MKFPFHQRYENGRQIICLFCEKEAHSYWDSDRDFNIECKCEKYKEYIELENRMASLENETIKTLEKFKKLDQIEKLKNQLKILEKE
jgi:hypothetical protein